MRNIIQSPHETLYQHAKDTAQMLVGALKKDSYAFAATHWEKGDHSVCISWFSDDAIKEEKYAYGTSSGMYMIEENDDSDVLIYFPKTTLAYEDFFDAISELHNNDNNLYYETIIGCAVVRYYAPNEAEILLLTDVRDLPAEAYESAKTLANEMVELLSDFEGINTLDYIESSENGEMGFEMKSKNYYVGVRLSTTLSN